jgi:hypothetical protein
MNKNFIKTKLRENLFDRIKEAGTNTPEESQKGHGHKQEKDKDEDKSDAKNRDEEKRSSKKDYNDVQNYFEKDLAFSQVAVMKKALGWDDDEVGVNRSLFGKMLHQDKNEKGGLYQFDDDQLDRVRTAIKNKQ